VTRFWFVKRARSFRVFVPIMSGPSRLGLPALLGLSIAATLPARAAPGAAAWDPGRRTTGALPGEIDPDAARGDTNGAYGRFGGDVSLALGAGAELADQARLAARLALHHFWMTGIYGYYADALGGDDPARLLSFGIDLRPAFLPRFSQNLQRGPAWLDLGIDSISLGLGVYYADRGDGFASERGFEASLGLGFPLLQRARGPWLEARGLLRWADDSSSSGRGAVVVMLAWHELWLSPLARGK